MTCCWNGLAVLSAESFKAGLRFRSSQPQECQASECSLMCEDFTRLGFRHVVMDPGVRLAYEREQVDVLQGAAATTAAYAALTRQQAAAAAAGGGVDDVLLGLGPWLPWSKVSSTSAALAAAAARAQQQQHCSPGQQHGSSNGSSGGVGGCGGPVMVECCDLLPGQSYVDFRHSCHMVDVLAVNWTAQLMASGRWGQ